MASFITPWKVIDEYLPVPFALFGAAVGAFVVDCVGLGMISLVPSLASFLGFAPPTLLAAVLRDRMDGHYLRAHRI